MIGKVQATDAASAEELKQLAEKHKTTSLLGSGRAMRANTNEGISGSVQFGPGEGQSPYDTSVANGQVTVGRHASHQAESGPLDGNQIVLGGMTVDRDIAIAQGLVAVAEDGSLVAIDDDARDEVRDHLDDKKAKEEEAAEKQAVFDAHNDALDKMEQELGHEAVVEMSNQIVETGDYDAEAVPAEVVQGFTQQAEMLAQEAGLENLGLMGMSLTDEEQQQARFALITGDQSTFQRLAARSVSQAHLLADDQDFRAAVVEAGGQVAGSGHSAVLIVDGQTYLLTEALRTGMLSWD